MTQKWGLEDGIKSFLWMVSFFVIIIKIQHTQQSVHTLGTAGGLHKWKLVHLCEQLGSVVWSHLIFVSVLFWMVQIFFNDVMSVTYKGLGHFYKNKAFVMMMILSKTSFSTIPMWKEPWGAKNFLPLVYFSLLLSPDLSPGALDNLLLSQELRVSLSQRPKRLRWAQD